MKKTIQKLKNQGGLASLKFGRSGSILAYTLIILFLILATAVGIATVSVMERKQAFSTDHSVQALQTANSGVEDILAEIKKASGSQYINAVLGTGCQPDGKIARTLDRGTVVMTLIDENKNELNCNDNTTKTIADIKEVKSVGHFSGDTRAVQVAVAENGGPYQTCVSTNDQLFIQYVNFADSCDTLDQPGSDWHQCNNTELLTSGVKGCLPEGTTYIHDAAGNDISCMGCTEEANFLLAPSFAEESPFYGGIWYTPATPLTIDCTLPAPPAFGKAFPKGRPCCHLGAHANSIGSCYNYAGNEKLAVRLISGTLDCSSISGFHQCSNSELIAAGKKGCLPSTSMFFYSKTLTYGCTTNNTTLRPFNVHISSANAWNLSNDEPQCAVATSRKACCGPWPQ